MKEFLVDRHTTPATPTLDPINVHKVPIYDTVADAEADLSNLEVGQILKTKDAGLVANLNPIDEVKQGVFLPPTSNAVAESLSYSTTEEKTGGKWIDGKPIYRKVAHVWHNNAPVSPYTLVNNHLSFWPSNDAEMITNYRGICIRTDGYVDVFVSGISVGTGMVPNLTNKNIYFNGLGTTQWSDGWIVIEYTKTTD